MNKLCFDNNKFKYNFIVNTNSMKNTAAFMKRVFRVSNWINKRYKLECNECDFNYYFHNPEQKQNITITLTFR